MTPGQLVNFWYRLHDVVKETQGVVVYVGVKFKARRSSWGYSGSGRQRRFPVPEEGWLDGYREMFLEASHMDIQFSQCNGIIVQVDKVKMAPWWWSPKKDKISPLNSSPIA